MLGVFAEFERALIQERVKAGLERARSEGTKLGRPRLPEAKEAEIRAILDGGRRGIRKTARLCGVGVRSVMRIRDAMR